MEGQAIQFVDIVGLAIGVPSVIVTIVACFYGHKAARSLGGEIGRAFVKLLTGIVLVLFSATFQGIVMGVMDIYESVLVAVVSSGTSLAGSIFLIAGFRGIIASTKV